MNQRFWTANLTKPVATLLALLSLLVLSACGGGGTGTTSPQTPTGTLGISPSTVLTSFGATPVTLVVSGGVKPYSLTSSIPSLIQVNSSIAEDGRISITPAFAPLETAVVTLTVRDGAQNVTTATVSVTGNRIATGLTVSPSAISVRTNVPVTFTISGGTAPYTVISSIPSLVPNPSSVDAQGRFTLTAVSVPASATPVLITIRDSVGAIVTASMTIISPALSVLPTTAIVYANNPVTLTISGGTSPYQAFSSNSVVLPVARNVTGDQIVLTPANVDADTPVTITITDSANGTVSASITVKPAPLLNTLTITPTPASPGVGCGSAVCAGQTASVTVTVRNVAGAGLSGRSVRFENVQGDYQFLTNGPGLPETLANSITVTTGQDGVAVVRLKANVGAPTQVALIRATELTSGNILNATFVIAQFTDGAGTLTAIPTSWTMSGPNSSNCASGTPVTYYIFGGTPPYRIQSTLPNFANIVPTLVQTNGGGFTAIPTGTVCTSAAGASITITDATGRTISVQLINTLGSGNPATNFRQIQFAPAAVTNPVGCGQSVIEQILGGEIVNADGSVTQPTFVVSTLGPNVTVTLSGRNLTISRAATGTATSPAIVFVSNGVSQTSISIPVAQTCGPGDTPPIEVMAFNPSSPLVVGCAAGASGSTTITPLNAGTPSGPVSYVGNPAFGGLTASIAGNVMTVTRTAAVTAGSASIPIIVVGTFSTTTGTPPAATTSTITGTLYVAPPGTCTP